MATLTVLIDDKLWLSSQLLEAGSCVLSGSSGSKLSLNKITTNHELLLIKGCLGILSTIGVQWTGAPARPWAYMLVVSWWSHWMHWWESWVGDGNVLRLSSSGSMHPAFTGTSECGKNSLVCSRNHDSVGWLLKKKSLALAWCKCRVLSSSGKLSALFFLQGLIKLYQFPDSVNGITYFPAPLVCYIRWGMWLMQRDQYLWAILMAKVRKMHGDVYTKQEVS